MARAFGYKVYIQPILADYIDLGQIATHREARTALAASGFIDRTTVQSNTAEVTPRGLGLDEDFYITIGEGVRTITNAALASNVASLTLGTGHGYTVGNRVLVENLPSPFASLNGTYVITATDGTTISYAKTGANITSASVVAGTARSGSDLKLDGTDQPFRLLGLESGPFSSDTDTEEDPTWDDETQGFKTGEAVAKTGSMAFSGRAIFTDSAYKIMRLCEGDSVSQGLYAKIAKIGPSGYNQTIFGYGRFDGYEDDDDAGTVVKWSSDFNFYGPAGLVLHQAA